MKTYRAPRDLLAAIEAALARKPALKAKTSSLEEAAVLLHRGRHYLWTSVYLLVGERLLRAASAGPENSCHTMLIGDGIVGRVARSGQMQLLADVSTDPSYRSVLPQTRSELAVPIKIAGHVIGVLNVESDQADAFGSEDRVLLKNIAARLARFLTGKGRYLVTRAATRLSDRTEARRQQPQSEIPKDMRAAVGAETRR